MRAHSIISTPMPITLMECRPLNRRIVESLNRYTDPMQRCSDVTNHVNGFSAFIRDNSPLRTSISLTAVSKPDPHRARDDGVTDVEFGQTRNLVDERDVFVIDAVTGVDLHMGF